MNDNVPPATPLALEIYQRFNRLMGKGGRIDRILNGYPDGKVEALPDAEIAVIKTQIETQLNEYEAAIDEAVAWHRNYKMRHRRLGFRCLQST